MHLLIVEDHEELWDFLSRRLQRRGFEVSVAQDGQDGLDKARSLSVEVIDEPELLRRLGQGS